MRAGLPRRTLQEGQAQQKIILMEGYTMSNNLSIRFDSYQAEDSGKWGKALERSCKVHFSMKDKVSRPGTVDFRRARVCYEVKSGAGEVKALINSKLKYVLYIPVVDEDKAEDQQEGFLLERETFLQILDDLGLLRRKVTTRGTETVSIQTFWNHSKNKPHGRKYYDLIDALYENSLMTLEDFFQAEGKIQ